MGCTGLSLLSLSVFCAQALSFLAADSLASVTLAGSMLAVDIALQRRRAREFLRRTLPLFVFSAILMAAIALTQHEGEEIVAGLLYRDGIEAAVLTGFRLFALGLAARLFVGRFGPAVTVRILSLLLAPLALLGTSGRQAARVVVTALALVPEAMPLAKRFVGGDRPGRVIEDALRISALKNTGGGRPRRRDFARQYVLAVGWLAASAVILLCDL